MQAGMTTCRLLSCFSLCCAFACATGVDISDEELAAILEESRTGAISTPPAGQSGSGGSSIPPLGNPGGGGPNGGTSAVGGAGGSPPPSMGFGGSGGSLPTSPVESGGPPVQVNPGNGCGSTAPAATGGCATGTSITVLYSDRSSSPGFNQLTMTISVENAGADFSLADLVLRYWFTADQGQTEFVGEVDYAEIGTQNVCISFGNQLGQNFADIHFTTSDSIGTGVQDLQVRLHTPNYAQQEQSNDFSFIAGADGVANANIAVYQAGTLVAGCEPE